MAWIAVQLVNMPVGFAENLEDSPEAEIPPLPLQQEHEVNERYSCDKQKTLYIMDQKKANRGVTNISMQCSRPFFAQKVS